MASSALQKATKLKDAGFTQLSVSVFLYEPTSTTASSPNDPRNILLCAWMGAPQRPLLRYTSKYQTLYPSSRIIVILSVPQDYFAKSYKKHHSELRPAVEALKASPGPTLAHIFSNGGTYIYRQLVELNGGPLPHVKGAVIDSAPGAVHLSNMTTPMITALSKNKIVQQVLNVNILVVCAFLKLYLIATGAQDSVTSTWHKFSGVEILPKEVKRTYVYSVKDEMVYADDVEKSIELVKEKGISVRKERYEDSAHVMHAVKDGDRYWGAVEGQWRWAN